MGFTLDVSISAVTVFLQGLLSFFSPCVLPLLPLYIGYLSGGTAVKGEDGRMHYKQSKVLLHTVFFVTGVSFAFFLLGLGVSAVVDFPQLSGHVCTDRRYPCHAVWLVSDGNIWNIFRLGKSTAAFRLDRLPCRRLQRCLWALLSALPGRPA